MVQEINNDELAWALPFPNRSGRTGEHSSLSSSTFTGRPIAHFAGSKRRSSRTVYRTSRAVLQTIADVDKSSTVPPRKQPTGIELGLLSVPEVTTPITLEIIGQLPTYLNNGTYYRNGPGLFEVKHRDGQEYIPGHWFDALGMVHAFFLDGENGTVRYRSKMTSEGVKRAIQSVPKHRYVAINFSRYYRPAKIMDRLVLSLGSLTVDPQTGKLPYSTSVSLQALPTKGILNASTDANVLHRLHTETLETVEEYDFSHFNPELTDPMTCAHGMLDSDTGEYFNFMMNYAVGQAEYKVFRIEPNGKTEIMTSFKDFPYYMHSFSLTENYVILVLWPAEVNLMKLLQTKSFTEGCQMRPDTPTKFMVISRKSNKLVCIYEHAPFFCFHTINAFECGDDIFIDLSYYKNLNIMTDLHIENIKTGGHIDKAMPVRFTLAGVSSAIAAGPTTPGHATSKVLANTTFEFGSVAPSKQRKRYRYAYGTSDDNGKTFHGGLAKLDIETGTILRWSSPDTFTGEPMFIPDPNGENEDDGSVIVVVLDVSKRQSSLIILDSRTMKEVARADVQMSLPLGFHGFFQP